jgi:hypothetical protein
MQNATYFKDSSNFYRSHNVHNCYLSPWIMKTLLVAYQIVVTSRRSLHLQADSLSAGQ